jgi:hypothetical protein
VGLAPPVSEDAKVQAAPMVRALPSVAGLKPDQGQSPKSMEWLTAGQSPRLTSGGKAERPRSA